MQTGHPQGEGHRVATDPAFDQSRAAGLRISRRIALVVIAGGSTLVGVWALLLPQSFFDDFPGMGWTWVAADGPYNEHLVRDVGSLNLALAFVAVMALVTRSPLLARVTGGATLVYGVPHLIYHATHHDGYGTSDVIPMLTSLTIIVLAAILVAVPPRHSDQHEVAS